MCSQLRAYSQDIHLVFQSNTDKHERSTQNGSEMLGLFS
jgi:hypothetical protein